MSNIKTADKKVVYYVLGGAALGAIAGYIVNKVGAKTIFDALKAKKIIPENIAETISEFASKSMKDLEEDD